VTNSPFSTAAILLKIISILRCFLTSLYAPDTKNRKIKKDRIAPVFLQSPIPVIGNIVAGTVIDSSAVAPQAGTVTDFSAVAPQAGTVTDSSAVVPQFGRDKGLLVDYLGFLGFLRDQLTVLDCHFAETHLYPPLFPYFLICARYQK